MNTFLFSRFHAARSPSCDFGTLPDYHQVFGDPELHISPLSMPEKSMDRGAWQAAVLESQRVRHDLVT